jgi:hypothetical protein
MPPETSTTPTPTLPRARALLSQGVGDAVPAAIVAAAFMALVRMAAGGKLGVFLGGLAALTLMVPGLSLLNTRPQRLLAPAASWLAVALVCALSVIDGAVRGSEWLRCMLVLLAWSAALCGVATALRRLRLPAVAASALTIVLAAAWLTWPIWMAPRLKGAGSERAAAMLVRPHPVFALNGAIWDSYRRPWPQHRLAYQLTNLGDDIAYTLPRSVWPCAILHSGIGAALLALAAARAGARDSFCVGWSQDGRGTR